MGIPLLTTAAAAAVVAVLSAVAAALCAARSWPIGVERRLRAQDERIGTLTAIVDDLNDGFRRQRTEVAAFLEDAEGVLESVERKRKRIAAHASKLNGGAEQLAPPGSQDRYAQLRALARQQGHDV